MSFTLIESTDQIAAAILALRDEQRQATLALKAIAAAITSKECCLDPIAPEIIYDCATGEIKFIDWQGNISPTFPGLYFPSNQNCINTINFGIGSGTNQPGSPDQPTWDETDAPWGAYNPDESDLYDDTLSSTANPDKCKKINLFLYISIEKLDTVSDLFEVGTLTMATLVGILSGGLAPLAFVTIGGAVVEFAVTISLIYGIAEVLMRAIPNWGDFSVGGTEQFKQDALCAMYRAATPSGVKIAWDNTIAQYFNWYAPQAYLLRSFLSPSMANAIANQNIVAREDQPRYLLSCDDCSDNQCSVGSWTATGCYWFSGSSWAGSLIVLWDGLNCADVTHDSGYRQIYLDTSKINPANGFMPRCDEGGAQTLGGKRIRVLTNTTGKQVTVRQNGYGQNALYLADDGTPLDLPERDCGDFWLVGIMNSWGQAVPSGSFTVEIF